ncbi:MAG: glutaredoxin-like domain protein [Chloroflexi bacterium]|nr:glutaredoxin-like domain protein [Chloroflexota bacterium]
MPIISAQDRTTITKIFDENLVNPVRLKLFTTPKSLLYVPGRASCETCDDVQELLQDVVEISDKLTLEVHNVGTDREIARQFAVERVPTLVIMGPDDGRVRYVGAPTGYEFATLLGDIQSASRGGAELAAETREALEAIDEPIHIQVFVTPTCPWCPTLAGLAHRMAMEFDNVRADIVEANEFPDLSGRYAVSGVPKTIINDKVEFVGAMPEAQFVAAIQQAVGIVPASQETSPTA